MEILRVGKILGGQDNKSFMHKKYPNCCNACGYPIEQEINQDFQVSRREYDISYTYDGYLIVSKRFKCYCVDRGFNNIVFSELPKEADFYYASVAKTIKLDYKKREVSFIDKCDVCEKYAEVIGATPAFIKDETQLASNEFYKSDLDFGSFEGKSPLIILNNEMAEELLKQKFKGLYFKDVLKS